MTKPAPATDRHRLLTETITIRETVEGGPAVITATLARGNIINRNHRYYSSTVLERAASAARDRVEAGKLIGLMDHPNFWTGDGDRGKPERTVIRWNRLWMDGPDLKGEGAIVETALGRDLRAMYDAKVHIGLSTNAYATSHFENAEDVPAQWDGDPNDLIQVIDDITELLTIDVVNDPSNVYAAVEQEARQARQAYREASMNKPETINPKPDEATDATAALEAEAAQLRADLETARAELAKQRREAIVTVALAKHGGEPADALVKAAHLTATAAESDEAAEKAVMDLLESVGRPDNGSNGVPAAMEGKPASDPLREARHSLKVN